MITLNEKNSIPTELNPNPNQPQNFFGKIPAWVL